LVILHRQGIDDMIITIVVVHNLFVLLSV